MANVIVEPDKREGGYRAMQRGRVVARGDTQRETGEKAHELRPHDTIEAARVRDTDEGIRDEFRLLHRPKQK